MHKDVYLADQSFQETNKNQVENIVLSTKVFYHTPFCFS
jgi:hypothetical protein